MTKETFTFKTYSKAIWFQRAVAAEARRLGVALGKYPSIIGNTPELSVAVDAPSDFIPVARFLHDEIQAGL